jgi:hypothetical protein
VGFWAHALVRSGVLLRPPFFKKIMELLGNIFQKNSKELPKRRFSPLELDAKNKMMIIRWKILAIFWSCDICIYYTTSHYLIIFSLNPCKCLKTFWDEFFFPKKKFYHNFLLFFWEKKLVCNKFFQIYTLGPKSIPWM